MIDWLIGV